MHQLDLNSWRTAMAQAIVPLEIQDYRTKSGSSAPFQGRYAQAAVGQVGLFDMETSAHIVRRTPAHITDEQPQFYKMSLQLTGGMMLEQDGRQALLSPGDLAVYDTHRPYTLTFPEPGRTMVMLFPQHMVELTAEEVGEVTAVRFPADHGFARMISPFFTELSKNLDQLNGAYATRLVHSALDLMMTMLAEELHHRHHRCTPAESLSRQIREYIHQNLGDPELSPASIAAAHYISLRYLYTLFSKEGQTVSAWIRAQRLVHIRRDLADPVYAGKPVSWVASRWGLPDAAHFSRLFKAEQGESPTAFRRRHLSSRSHQPISASRILA